MASEQHPEKSECHGEQAGPGSALAFAASRKSALRSSNDGPEMVRDSHC